MTAKRKTNKQKSTVLRMPLSRSAIVAAARDMIIENGHEALSLRPLAGRLGVTAAAIYVYVDDKHDLLRTVAVEQYNHLAKMYAAIETNEPLEKIREIGRIYVAYAMNNPELFQVMFLFPPLLGDDFGEDDVVWRQAFEIAEKAVGQAIVEGKLADNDPVELSLAIWAAVHGVAMFNLTNTLTHPGGSRGDYAGKMVDTVLTGLLNGLGPSAPGDAPSDNPSDIPHRAGS